GQVEVPTDTQSFGRAPFEHEFTGPAARDGGFLERHCRSQQRGSSAGCTEAPAWRPRIASRSTAIRAAGLPRRLIWYDATRSLLGGLDLTHPIRHRVAPKHDRLAAHLDHVMVTLVRDEVPRQGAVALVNAGRVAARNPLQLLTCPVAQRPDELHEPRFVGPRL